MTKQFIEDFLKSVPFSGSAKIAAFDENGIVAIEKAANVMSHPNPNGGKAGRTLVKARYNFDKQYYSWQDENGEKRRLHLINRLDSHTSGLIIASIDEKAADAAREAFKNRKVEKTYNAICTGRPMLKSGIWRDYISKENFASKFVRAVSPFGGKTNSESSYEVLKSDQNGLGLTLMKLCPHTGRTHQLRIQCAKRKAPILGDGTYGDFSANKRIKKITGQVRLFLHCLEISFNYDLNGKTFFFSAKSQLPEDFEKIINYNGKAVSAKIEHRQW